MSCWLLVGALSVILVTLLSLVLKKSEESKLFELIPGPAKLPFIGHTLMFIRGRERIFQIGRELNSQFSISRIEFLDRRIVNISHPDDIEVVLSNSKHNRKSFLYSYVRPWLQDGLLLSDGSKWHSRRKILTPAFHFHILREFTRVIEENSRRLVQTLELEAVKERTSIIPLITDFTLHSICETAMGTRLDSNDDSGRKYQSAVHQLGDCIVYRMARFWLMPAQTFALSSTGRLHDKLLNILKKFTKQVINERREYKNREGFSDITESDDTAAKSDTKRRRMAMLDLLLSAEKDGLIDANGIQEEVDTFMFEGHDTTMTGLVFALMLLANHPEVQTKVFEECQELMGKSDREATMNDLVEMRYLECCIKESLRLYPSVPFISRILGEETVLSGYRVPAETSCHIHIYDLHRRADFWPDPTEFKPDRFLKENCTDRHHFAYVPFSAGPRNCIGQRFAMLELKSALSAIVRRYELIPVTRPSQVTFLADLILRSRDPIYIRFRRRT